jgi:hypothetical protein
MRRQYLIRLGLTVLLALAGVAWASVPDSSGIIHACYSTSTNPNTRGALRVIDTDAGESCGNNELPIAWSQFERTLYVKNFTFDFPVGPRTRTLECDPGDIATGGGFRIGSGVQGVRLQESWPTLSLNGWNLTINNEAGATTTAEIFVICKDLT